MGGDDEAVYTTYPGTGEYAKRVIVVNHDEISGGGGGGDVPLDDFSIALAITAQSISLGDYSQEITFATDAIIDQMVLYFTPGGTCDSQITLEDTDTGALFLDIQLNNNSSVVVTDMKILMDPSKSLTLTIGQSSGCTVNGFVLQRT